MKIIGLTGPAGCGKSTVADILATEDRFGFIEESFAYPLRSFVCSIAGFGQMDLERTKENPAALLCGLSPREFMQRLGTEFGRELIGADLWIRALERRIDNYHRFMREHHPPQIRELAYDGKLAESPLRIVVSDVRFPNEADWIRANGTLWHLTRPGKTVRQHVSERGVSKTDRDESLDNNCDLETLHDRIADLLGADR